MNITQHTINGLSVVFAEMADAPSTTVQVLVKAGSVYEQSGTNGLSHFLEHMFFKGGKRYPTAKSVTEALDLIGAECNAFTGDEYAGYRVKCAPLFVDKALDILSDMLVNSAFDPEEIEKEKGVIVQEIKMYEDMPHQEVWNKWKRWYFGDNPFGWPILGPEENVRSFGHEDFLQHKEALYTKDNLVIVIAGAIDDKDALLGSIGELFGALPEKCIYTEPTRDASRPEEHEAFTKLDTQQHHLVMGADGWTMHENERFAASMLSVILGGTMSSRLFQEIREKHGLCYYVGSSNDLGSSSGTFFVYGGMEKGRREMALEAIYKEIGNIVQEGITDDEFEKARLHIQGSLAMSIETSHKLAAYVGKQALFKDAIDDLDTVLKNYLAVEKDAINACSANLAKSKLWAHRVE